MIAEFLSKTFTREALEGVIKGFRFMKKTLLALALVHPAIAQESDSSALESLDPTLITSSRLALALEDTPYTAYELDRQFIDDQLIRSLPDALRNVPGVLIQKTAHGHGSPFIRGFTGRQNLLLVDGVRMNNSTWRNGPVQYWNTFDQLNIKQVEVIKSQGSVQYGSDAIGGTVNLLTKNSGFRDESGSFFHGMAHYRFDTNSESHVGRLETRFGQGEQWGVTLGTSLKDFGDIRDSAVGLMEGTGHPEQAYDFKFEAALGESSTFTFAHQYLNQDDVSRWHRTLNNPGWIHGNNVVQPGSFIADDYDQERSLTYARLEGTLDGHFIDRYRATLSYQKAQDSTVQIRNATDIRRQNIDVETYGFDLSLESEIGPGTLVYGLDYYRDEIDATGSRSNGNDNRPLADDSSYDLLGLFAQYRWSPIERLTITPGLRYSYARAELGEYLANGTPTSSDNSWDDLVFEIRGLYQLDQSWSLFGGVSQAFRAPNLNDLTGNVVSGSGVTNLGSLSVEPEQTVTYELGARYNGDNLSLQIAGFYSELVGLIGRRVTGTGAEVLTNADDGYVFGVEAELAWRFARDWEWRVFASAMDSQVETADAPNGEPIRRSAPFMGGTSLRWTSPELPLWIEARIQAAASAGRLAAADIRDDTRFPSNGTPSYLIPSLYAGYQVSENLELTLALENLTDEDYRYHGSGQNEPGFNAIFGVTTRW